MGVNTGQCDCITSTIEYAISPDSGSDIHKSNRSAVFLNFSKTIHIGEDNLSLPSSSISQPFGALLWKHRDWFSSGSSRRSVTSIGSSPDPTLSGRSSGRCELLRTKQFSITFKSCQRLTNLRESYTVSNFGRTIIRVYHSTARLDLFGKVEPLRNLERPVYYDRKVVFYFDYVCLHSNPIIIYPLS